MITTVHDISARHALESHLADQMFHNPSGLVNHTLPTIVLAPSAVGKGQRMCCCTTPDAAMYLAQRAGKARIVMFDLSMVGTILDHVTHTLQRPYLMDASTV
jgi:hypothetical protein